MRVSPQAEQFKKCLPDELQKIAEVSFSDQRLWKLISGHLRTLFGTYADPQFCLDSYYHSPEYTNARQIIRRCSDLPLIGMDEIQDMLDEEAEYAGTVKELLAINQGENDGALDRAASLLGIFPDENPRALYRSLVAKRKIPPEEWAGIRMNATENRNLLKVVTDCLTGTFTPGYLLEFPAVGSVMTQPRSRYYYRGENAYYRSSKASSYRRAANPSRPASVNALIDRMRLYQCWETLDQFDAVRRWGFCEINYLALAQHYGFRTPMLDVTSDLKTALFFACCTFGEDHKWHPLTGGDFAHRSSRKFISSGCNGDSRYGVLFRSPSEITDLEWCTVPDDTAFEIVIPVGYQPFMRCSRQHGYMLWTQQGYDLFQDKRFDKMKFCLTEELCNWIYEEMGRGEAIYPNDDVPDISLEFGRLNDQNVFCEQVFESAMQDFHLKKEDWDMARQALETYGFTIRPEAHVILPERVAEINAQYPVEYAMKMTGLLPQMRPIMTLPGDTMVETGEDGIYSL